MDAAATSDASSGRGGLALIRLSEAHLERLSLGGLEAVAPDAGSPLSLFLDERDGGGLVVPARIVLPFAGARSEPVSLGVHATADRSLRLLADGASVAGIPLGAGWRIEGLRLAYTPDTDSWTAGGGVVTPVFGLGVTGPISAGRPDALGVTTTRPVAFGRTGLVLSSVEGSLQGLLRAGAEAERDRLGPMGLAGGDGARGLAPRGRRHRQLHPGRPGRLRAP